MDFLYRLLELARRELGAEDARVEIGGRDPDDDRFVWTTLPQGWRVVALFRDPPHDPAGKLERLETLVGAFGEATSGVPSDRPPPPGDSVAHLLDDELAALARRARAIHTAIIDHSSPVLWASSELPRHDGEDVEQLREAARVDERARRAGIDLSELLAVDAEEGATRLRERPLDVTELDRLVRAARRLRDQAPARDADAWRRHLLLARAVTVVRDLPADEHRLAAQSDGFGYLARQLSDIYHVVLAFDGPFSELHAEAATVHAIHYLERLVAGLPPRDPGAGDGRTAGAKVLRLRR